MVKMSAESRAFLGKNLPDVANADDPNDILEPLYNLIVYKGFDAERKYNNFGNMAQAVYDDIFYSNFD